MSGAGITVGQPSRAASRAAQKPGQRSRGSLLGSWPGSLRARWNARTVICMAGAWQVEPSGALRGDIRVRGSKNAVSKHMVAAMLGDGPSTIRNVPEVGEVDITAAMLESAGFHVGREDGEITIAPGSEVRPKVPEAFTGLNRLPILMLGPLLHLTGEAFVPLVGGDPIGRRPV